MTGRLAQVTPIEKAHEAWKHGCACGLEYRVAPLDDGHSFWPRNAAVGSGRTALAAGDACLRCGSPLTVDAPDAAA
jgi:hypothetical protein